MKKRRVLALLLALSLAVSTNGMTVFATEPGELTAPAVSLAEESTEDVQDEAEQTDAAADDADEEQDIDSEDTGKSDEEVGEDSDVSGEKDSDEQNSDIEDAGGETVSDNDLPDEEPAAEETEGLPEAVKNEVRMMTFTDDTGLKITYDANAAENNADKVTITDAGVLTESAEDIAGVVDLRDKNITEIANNAFASRTKITYVMLPKSVTKIGTGAFEDCSALKGISIPSRLTAVGDNAFKNCKALTQLALPNSVTSIGASAFQDDSRLFMVHMVSAEYSKLTTIGASAFEGCSSLELFCSDEAYNLPKSITGIGASAFKDCAKISKVGMSDQIASLGAGVYQNCTGLKEVVLSSGLETIPTQAFEGCKNLERVIFGNANINISTTIEGNAFKGCIKLGSIEIPEQIISVGSNAFADCTALRRIEVVSSRTVLDPGALPNSNAKDGMCIVGRSPSKAKEYADEAQIRFIAVNEAGEEFYTYKAYISGAGTATSPRITVKVTTVSPAPSNAKDINDIENGPNTSNGVKADTICYFNIEYNGVSGCRPVSGSIKCNGTPMERKDGSYFFIMPKGGAVITAEFELDTKEVLVDGDEESIEGRLSSEAYYDAKTNTGRLKVGQSAKFYLTNNRNGAESRIPTSKVTYGIDRDLPSGIVSIDANGTVKALKPGTAIVTATVQVAAEKYVEKQMIIEVEQMLINHISMLVPDLDSNMTLIEEEGKTAGLSISSAKVSGKEYSFDLRAIAFSSEEDDEAIETAFTWATSDAKVAKVGKTSTSAASSTNKITIPKGTDGEATITVTATDANKNKVTKKFVVRVESYQPRLTTSQITINPNQVEGATKIGIINSYGQKIKPEFEVLDAQTKTKTAKFRFTPVAGESNDLVSTYSVTANTSEMVEKKYSVLLRIEVANVDYDIPLTITVKKSLPNPSVSFDSKAPKINLFYAKDGTPIQPIVSKLGDAVVSEYSLEPLTKEGDKGYKEDDAKFLDNFEINENTGEIKQKAAALKVYESNKKPVVSGYLVLKFENYRPEAKKRYKITIPTQTTIPTFVLDRTADTFSNSFREDQIIYLQLLDKKTKKPIEWNDSYADSLTVESNSTCDAKVEIQGMPGTIDGVKKNVVNFVVTFKRGMAGGSLNLKLVNKKWAEGKSAKFTYTIKVDQNFCKLSLKKSTITLNANSPEKTESFALISNQRDTVFEGETQYFEERPTAKNAAQYALLDVNCEDGEGTVAFALDGHSKDEIVAGNYKYVYTYRDKVTDKDKTVTLTVKVVKTNPTVTLKGSNVFNLNAYTEKGDTISYVETAEMTVTAKNLPDNPKHIETPSTPDVPGNSGGESGTTTPGGSDIGETEGTQSSRQTDNPEYYAFNAEKSFNSIICTTRGYTDMVVRDYFDFQWEEGEKSTDGKIRISLEKELPQKSFTFKMMPYYSNATNEMHPAKEVGFTIKICRSNISVRLTAKGKINLLDRKEECTEKNAIRYTPVFSNLKDTIGEVVLLDASNGRRPLIEEKDKISDLFDAEISPDGKSFFVVPKPDVELNNNQNYELRVWIKAENYESPVPDMEGGFYPASTIKVKTAQILPKVKTDKTAVDLYLSNKDYTTSFLVQKSDESAIGTITDIAFGEKDDKANESFVVEGDKQSDGSLLVHLKLKNGVSYGCNSTNKIKMYIKFKGQGDNTEGTAITMNVKINK